ncbi:hypothetical protein [Deinococcus sedimenti]|uniref:Uncharacterized protein n=1 Tax=Deinococcus sedimenti TaxID=1867090 RepID=A0ABQ2S6T3_9DEIO|nr:hypothetical protein [Deinococcus sedimenti]GGS02684.1 hypothetical protein GCM10008960_31620 [Deinococcus sedimenti]
MIPALQQLLVAPDGALPTAHAVTLAHTSPTGDTTKFAVLATTPAAARRLRALIPLIDGQTSTDHHLVTQGDEHWLITAAGHAGRLRPAPHGGFNLSTRHFPGGLEKGRLRRENRTRLPMSWPS